jgi:hypothetical protein
MSNSFTRKFEGIIAYLLLFNFEGKRFMKHSFIQYRLHSNKSTAVAWREKKFKHFVFYKYFSLVLGLLKSRISEKNNRAPFEQT